MSPVAVSRTDGALLVVAVVAVSTSAPLIREAAAPALVVAFWRNALASGALVPGAVVRRRRRGRRPAQTTQASTPAPTPSAPTVTRGAGAGRSLGPQGGDGATRRAWQLSVVAGLFLAAHFAAWIPSLSLTSVSSSVALVATQPIWAALIAGALGRPVGRFGWAGIGVALGGVLLITGVDVGTSGRALGGDLLAVAGGVLAAAYVSVGALARRQLSTTDYTACCYSVASLALLAACVVARQPLAGFGLRTWVCLVAITVGPQLLGHSLFNRVVRTTGATVVSVAVLAEIIGASLLAFWWFGESPPAALAPAAVCIAAGVVLVVRSVAPSPEEEATEAVEAATLTA